ncbi:hypothetical protein AGMMS49938_18860 [Fibrobacterales bacterium]|nr:hypothetical protein AGMMS49938_18860 [Fibrobacterales bacterium]
MNITNFCFTDSSPLTKFLYNIWWYSKGQQNDAVVDFYQTNELDKYFKKNEKLSILCQSNQMTKILLFSADSSGGFETRYY